MENTIIKFEEMIKIRKSQRKVIIKFLQDNEQYITELNVRRKLLQGYSSEVSDIALLRNIKEILELKKVN